MHVVTGWAGMTRGITGAQRQPPKPIRKIASANSCESRAFISGNLRIDIVSGVVGIHSEAVGPPARVPVDAATKMPEPEGLRKRIVRGTPQKRRALRTGASATI